MIINLLLVRLLSFFCHLRFVLKGNSVNINQRHLKYLVQNASLSLFRLSSWYILNVANAGS